MAVVASYAFMNYVMQKGCGEDFVLFLDLSRRNFEVRGPLSRFLTNEKQ
jgi:hypothetical protein